MEGAYARRSAQMGKGMATLKDVAKESGLTVTTVSRVLNNRGYISEETRIKVKEAMKKLNYQPNEVARSLSKQTTNIIGVIVPHIVHPYFSKLISRLESAAYEKGYRILLFNTKEKEEKEAEYLEMCKSNRVAGIILCSGGVHTDKFKGLNVPLITIERSLESGTASVECDNRQGGRLAAEHLAGCGCKNVLHLSGITDFLMPADDREEGFVEVCKRMGLNHHEIKNNTASYMSMEYHPYIEEALEKYPETDGIFASSDVIAAQVLQVCAKRGIQVPRQMKVIGFDDVDIAVLTVPMITTVRQPLKEMAQVAMNLMTSAIGKQIVPSRTMLPVTLVKRGTT